MSERRAAAWQAQPAQAQPRSRSTMAQVAGAKRAQERPAQAARHVGWSSGSAVAAAASARKKHSRAGPELAAAALAASSTPASSTQSRAAA